MYCTMPKFGAPGTIWGSNRIYGLGKARHFKVGVLIDTEEY